MKSMCVAVGIFLFALTSKTCAPTMAREAEQCAEAGVLQGDPPEQSGLATSAKRNNANRVRPKKGFQRGLCPTILVGDQTAPSLDQRRSPAPSITNPRNFFAPWNAQGPSIYGQVEALFMMRESRFARQPIVVDPNTSTTFLSTSDLDFNFDSGLRATVGIPICGGWPLEFSYFGLFQGDAAAIAASPDPNAFLIFPDNFFGNVFVDMDSVRVNYSTSLHNAEINLLPCRCDECNCGAAVDDRSFQWIAGFRYLNLDDELSIAAQRIVAGGVEEGAYDIRTANHLYGVQLGARVRRSPYPFGWEATGKAGIFGNDAQQEQSVTDFPNFPIRPTVSSTGGNVVFLGEFNLTALYRFTDVWNLRAGYSMLWIEGIALAPDQLDFNFATSPSGDQLDTDGGMLLHGANVGLEARW